VSAPATLELFAQAMQNNTWDHRCPPRVVVRHARDSSSTSPTWDPSPVAAMVSSLPTALPPHRHRIPKKRKQKYVIKKTAFEIKENLVFFC